MKHQFGWKLLLISSTLGLSWLLMMAVHEFGHVLHAWTSGGQVERVVLHPLAISRTDVSPNPHPLWVAWGGAIWGVAVPLLALVSARLPLRRYQFLFAFFAGFCCLANGLYLAVGSLSGVGDAGDLLRHGALRWQLLGFGLPLSVLGLWLWNGLGKQFGLGPRGEAVDRRVAMSLAIALGLVALVTSLLSTT